MRSLSAAKKIDPPGWMTGPEVAQLMGILNQGGEARFVGGCVRNELLGAPVSDIDIATTRSPLEVIEILEAAGLKVVPTGIDYGTVTAVVNKKGFEITTLRRDVETDGRRAIVAYTHDWREDAARRDFTMNTLLADMDGQIYDPTGRGLSDLEKRQVIFVGDPAARIAEDYLRILRFFRFHAWYGKGAPDAKALAACRDAAGKIAGLSAERVTQEWFKILSVSNPMDILKLILKNNVLKDLFHSDYKENLMERVCDLQEAHDLFLLSTRLFILAGLEKENINQFSKLLIIPKVILKDIESIQRVLDLPAMVDDHDVRVAVYKYGRDAAAQALLILEAKGALAGGFLERAVEITRNWDIPKLPVSGEDLKKAGIDEGPALGGKLKEIEDWWIDQDFQPDRAACLKSININ